MRLECSTNHRRVLSLGLTILCCLRAHAVPQVYALGFLGPDGPSLANGVSADGLSVVGTSNSPFGLQGFRWRLDTGMVGLGDLPGGFFSSQANACDARGRLVTGGSDDGSAGEGGTAFVWSPGTGMSPLGDLQGYTTYGQGMAVSDDGGVIVGMSQSPYGVEAFRWSSNTGMLGLGDFSGGSYYSCATGITGNGSTVCGYGSGSAGMRPFRWNSFEGLVPLDVSGAALGVSDDGSTFVGQFAGDAARWTVFGREILFPSADRTTSFAADCTADGKTVVGLADYSGNTSSGHAFVWDPVHGKRSLRDVLASMGVNVAGMQFLSASGISRDGRVIVGYGDFGRGQEAYAVVFRDLQGGGSGFKVNPTDIRK